LRLAGVRPGARRDVEWHARDLVVPRVVERDRQIERSVQQDEHLRRCSTFRHTRVLQRAGDAEGAWGDQIDPFRHCVGGCGRGARQQCAFACVIGDARACACQLASMDVHRRKSSATARRQRAALHRFEDAAQMRGGSQAHPRPSYAPVAARLAVHARSHSMAPN
jgi:hypothetical protein